jgi:hypothetical protein
VVNDMRRPLAATLFASLVAIASLAHSETDAEKAKKAQGLYDEAKTLAANGDWAAACPKLESSKQLVADMKTVYRLAECYEHVGKPASAWRNYREAAIAATKAGETPKARAALDRAAQLEPKLPKLSVSSLAGDAAELRIDDIVIPPPWVGAPFPVDPGEHAVIVSAPDKKPFKATLTIPNDTSTTSISVPALEDTVKEPMPLPSPVEAKNTSSASSTTRTLGMVMVGGGVVLTGVGVFLGLKARSKYHDADEHCPAAGCDDVGATETADARSLGNVATIVVGAGLAIGVTGVVLWATSPSSADASAKTATSSMKVTATPTGLMWSGAF